MPNVAAALKEEITRLARKELRSQTGGMKKASAQYRRDIAALKRQLAKLQRQVSHFEGQVSRKAATQPAGETATQVRFTAKGLCSERERLGLSADNYAKLVGVSARSIYNWEQEAARPRKDRVAILAALRGIGKKEAQARLAQRDKKRTRRRARKS